MTFRFAELLMARSMGDPVRRCLAYNPNGGLHSVRSIWEVDEKRGCRWRMDCKVDRCQHAQRGQKGYHIEIGIVQDSDQPTDEIRRGWGLSG